MSVCEQWGQGRTSTETVRVLEKRRYSSIDWMTYIALTIIQSYDNHFISPRIFSQQDIQNIAWNNSSINCSVNYACWIGVKFTRFQLDFMSSSLVQKTSHSSTSLTHLPLLLHWPWTAEHWPGRASQHCPASIWSHRNNNNSHEWGPLRVFISTLHFRIIMTIPICSNSLTFLSQISTVWVIVL